MGEDAYREFLARVTGQRSAANLSAAERGRVLDALRGLGWAGKPRDRARPGPGKGRLLGKARAMLRAAGRDDNYGDAMARHMFRIDCMEWLDADQLRRLVIALSYDERRRAKRAKRAKGEEAD